MWRRRSFRHQVHYLLDRPGLLRSRVAPYLCRLAEDHPALWLALPLDLRANAPEARVYHLMDVRKAENTASLSTEPLDLTPFSQLGDRLSVLLLELFAASRTISQLEAHFGTSTQGLHSVISFRKHQASQACTDGLFQARRMLSVPCCICSRLENVLNIAFHAQSNFFDVILNNTNAMLIINVVSKHTLAANPPLRLCKASWQNLW